MKILVKPRPAKPFDSITVTPETVIIRSRSMRVLDFDVEARPLHWISGDYVSKEITAMAWAWCDKPDEVTCYLLGETEPKVMLAAFVEAFNQADMVTGHYIRGYDLPMINGSLTEYGLPVLADKLTCDTKTDLIKRMGLSSSQENLGAMLMLEHDKVKMDQRSWRDANRLTPEGREKARERVVGDVRQHIELRRRLMALGYLGPAVKWTSGGSDIPAYAP